jgi:hypothetical protein
MVIPRSYSIAVLITLTSTLVGCIDPNSPGYTSPYGSPYGGYQSPPPPAPYYRGSSYDNDYYERQEQERLRRDRRDVDRDRDRLEQERERLEQERAQQNRPLPPPPPPRVQESCPSGYSQSEQKCSSDERKRGCRDMRLPGGLGCVSR